MLLVIVAEHIYAQYRYLVPCYLYGSTGTWQIVDSGRRDVQTYPLSMAANVNLVSIDGEAKGT